MTAVLDYSDLLISGTLVTISISLCSLLLAVFIGIWGALAKVYGGSVLQAFSGIYTTFIRSVPDLCLMLLLYYGGQEIVNRLGDATGLWRYLEINQFAAGVFTIGIIYGAYMTETFRGAILSIPRGQMEAAQALNLPRSIAFRKVILPQLCYYALPSFGNNWLVLLKTTALVSIIGLQDIVWQAFAAGRTTRQLFTFFFVTLLVYLAITFISDQLLSRLERKVSVGFRKSSL